MPEPRLSKSIARWVAVKRPRRMLPLRRAVRVGCAIAAALAVVWLGYSAAIGDRRLYRAGPVAEVHQSFANQCHQCHQQSWQGLSRLATLDNSHTSTPNAACETCHSSSMHRDHPLAAVHQCADCHREHQGAERLVRVEQSLCVECHGDLRTDESPPRNFVASIADFASHPEFALFRDGQDPAPGTEHRIHDVAALVSDDQGTRWIDKTPLRFNHQVHLNPDGVPLPAGDGQDAESRSRETLTCASCHEPDAHNSYLMPPRYEAHCQRCHPLQFVAEPEAGDARSPMVIPLPHREVPLVRAAIRQWLSEAFADGQPIGGSNDDEALDVSPEELLEMPGLPSPRPVRPGELAWLNRWLMQADHVVFGPEAKGGCRYCHSVTQEADSWKVAPPEIPRRWLSHGRFDHGRHRTIDCEHCHAASVSQQTSDILLPKIDVCHACHRPADGAGLGGARSDCAECHDYHAPMPLDIRPRQSTDPSSEE